MEFSVKDILQMEVTPALGCTEPVAIALAAAAARSLTDSGSIETIQVWVDPNVYKNGVAVAIPGTDGLCGLDTAAALGAVGGDPALRLEVLEPVDKQIVSQARALLKDGKVKVHLLTDQRGLYVKALVKSGGHEAQSVIEHLHDNLTGLFLDGEKIDEHPLLENANGRGSKSGKDLAALESWLKELRLSQLLGLIDDLDKPDLDFIQEGIVYNQRLAQYGLKHGCGLGVGKTLQRLVRQRLLKKDMMSAARILTSAAADARMAGVKMAAMSSAGSGNHGLTAILPIVAVKDFVTAELKTLHEAIALSHIITGYIKAFTGRLSAVCGCSVAAGAGAAAGVAYMLGGDSGHIAGAIKNLIVDLAGVICDGAKASCALKLATAGGTAIQAALFALQNVIVSPTDGIACATPEGTMRNIGTLTTEGMIATDQTILNIMLEKRFSA
ncbi:MAG: serine dehydratase subunit alpha family protein [Desulfobacteraceae bacterium]|nr:serine dehydratase subunit alpha family protein [Desulfobacteraceae bacterium]